VYTENKIVRLNNKPSKPDSRDLVYKFANVEVPELIDLREYDRNIENQETLGSCTASAITSGYEVSVKVCFPDRFMELSRLFVYYHSRLFADNLDSDAGAYIRDGLKSIKNYGVCSEESWPYVIGNYAVQPSPKCYLDASKRKINNYSILYTNEEIKEVLTGKRPVVVSMEIFQEFASVSKENPFVPLPAYFTYSAGYHAVLIMGYDDQTDCFLIKNSYGISWGDNSYAWLPYSYMIRYGFERWCFEINNQRNL
jgi:C1A family cysteine protease